MGSSDARAAFVAATEIDELPAARIRARVRASSGPPRRRWGWGAAAVVGLVAAALIAGLAGGTPDPMDHVTLSLDGLGQVTGTPVAPVIEWSEGRVSVEVTPGQGIELAVKTPEAWVRVVGTVFEVERHLGATDVVVHRGAVEVTCGDATTPRVVVGGGTLRCLPVAPAALLERAVAQRDQGAPPMERLDTVAAGRRAAPAGTAIAAELLAHHVWALADAGRTEAAVARARDYLASGIGPRRPEMWSTVALAAFEGAGCDATADLEGAVSEVPPGPEWVMLGACLMDADPGRAQIMIHGALPHVSGPWRDLAEQLSEEP